MSTILGNDLRRLHTRRPNGMPQPPPSSSTPSRRVPHVPSDTSRQRRHAGASRPPAAASTNAQRHDRARGGIHLADEVARRPRPRPDPTTGQRQRHVEQHQSKDSGERGAPYPSAGGRGGEWGSRRRQPECQGGRAKTGRGDGWMWGAGRAPPASHQRCRRLQRHQRRQRPCQHSRRQQRWQPAAAQDRQAVAATAVPASGRCRGGRGAVAGQWANGGGG